MRAHPFFFSTLSAGFLFLTRDFKWISIVSRVRSIRETNEEKRGNFPKMSSSIPLFSCDNLNLFAMTAGLHRVIYRWWCMINEFSLKPWYIYVSTTLPLILLLLLLTLLLYYNSPDSLIVVAYPVHYNLFIPVFTLIVNRLLLLSSTFVRGLSLFA